MSWRDGCEPLPPPAPGAEAVPFDFAAADAIGERLDALRRAVAADREARAAAVPLLAGWTGPHRETYDRRRGAHEAVLAHHDLGRELARLRAAWDRAARAQRLANARAGPGDGADLSPPSARPWLR